MPGQRARKGMLWRWGRAGIHGNASDQAASAMVCSAAPPPAATLGRSAFVAPPPFPARRPDCHVTRSTFRRDRRAHSAYAAALPSSSSSPYHPRCHPRLFTPSACSSSSPCPPAQRGRRQLGLPRSSPRRSSPPAESSAIPVRPAVSPLDPRQCSALTNPPWAPPLSSLCLPHRLPHRRQARARPRRRQSPHVPPARGQPDRARRRLYGAGQCRAKGGRVAGPDPSYPAGRDEEAVEGAVLLCAPSPPLPGASSRSATMLTLRPHSTQASGCRTSRSSSSDSRRISPTSRCRSRAAQWARPWTPGRHTRRSTLLRAFGRPCAASGRGSIGSGAYGWIRVGNGARADSGRAGDDAGWTSSTS